MTPSETKPVTTDEKVTPTETLGGWLSDIEPFIARRFGDLFPAMSRLRPGRFAAESPAPRVDMFDKDGEIVVKADLPGVKKENVSVAIENGALLIKGERDDKTEVNEKDYYRIERSSGSFYRRIPLPAGVNASDVTASYTDGTLDVHIKQPAAAVSSAQPIPLS